CYIRSVLITENYHAYGVAHEDNVDATLIEQTRGRVIVRRKRSNLLAAPLHFAKVLHCACSQDQLPISERKLDRKAKGRRPNSQLTRNESKHKQLRMKCFGVRMRPGVAC